MSFDVLAALRTALAESDEPDPVLVAIDVAANVPDADLRDALAQALRRLASSVAGEARRRHQVELLDSITVSTAAATATRPAGRDRWSQAGSAYKKLLQERLVTANGTKLIRDCTAADFRWAAAERHEHAGRVRAHGDWFVRWAETLERHSAAVAADLPDNALQELAEVPVP
jgi:hypothetical protein